MKIATAAFLSVVGLSGLATSAAAAAAEADENKIRRQQEEFAREFLDETVRATLRLGQQHGNNEEDHQDGKITRRKLQDPDVICPALESQFGAQGLECNCALLNEAITVKCKTPDDEPNCSPADDSMDGGAAAGGDETCAAIDTNLVVSDLVGSEVTVTSCYEYAVGQSPSSIEGKEMCMSYSTVGGGFSCSVTLDDDDCAACNACGVGDSSGAIIDCKNLEPGMISGCRALDTDSVGVVPTFPDLIAMDAVTEPTTPAPSPESMMCGTAVCTEDEYCCNESCSICAPLDGGCTAQFCEPDDDINATEPDATVTANETEAPTPMGPDDVNVTTEAPTAESTTNASDPTASPTEGGTIPPEELCVISSGTVTTAMCCGSAPDFPDTCLIGACGCAPMDSKNTTVCDCGDSGCYDADLGCVFYGDPNATMGPTSEPTGMPTEPLNETQLTELCLTSNGTVEMGMCCVGTDPFPNSCLIGACGCGPMDSENTTVCSCPEDTCFDPWMGGCVVPMTMSPTMEPTMNATEMVTNATTEAPTTEAPTAASTEVMNTTMPTGKPTELPTAEPSMPPSGATGAITKRAVVATVLLSLAVAGVL